MRMSWIRNTVLLLLIVCVVGYVIIISTRGEHQVWDVFNTANVKGHVIDKNTGLVDNFINGRVIIDVIIMSGDINDVLDPVFPVEITIWGHGKQWSVPIINLRANSGKTENNYGENIECDGVVAGPDNSSDNLYVRISVPTTPDGDVIPRMIIKVEMWPTDDAVDAVDGTISPASFDNMSFYDWWDEGNTINIHIQGRQDVFRFVGYYDGAYLEKIEIDE